MKSNTPRLSPRVQQIYDFLLSYTDEHGYPPSVREIGCAVGLKSPSTVHMHLRTLEDYSLIKRTANKSRTIEFVQNEDGHHFSSAADGEIRQTQIHSYDTQSYSLPLVGRVAAGMPILAEENIEEYFSLPSSLISDTSTFVLQVRGNSMINAGIFDGDYLVIAPEQNAQNGQIVVALIDDSATVKTFYREKDICRLQPENDAMDPIYVKNPQIVGKVTAVLRTLL